MKRLQGFFDAEREDLLLSWFWLGALFLVGMILWGSFLNFGAIPFDFHDWAEVNVPRLAFLKDAVTRGQFPFHMQDTSALRGVTDRYMALPDVLLTPQVLLMKWLDVGDFVLVHTWLLYALGFWGLIRLKKRFDLSLFAFIWLFFLFNFNGHLTSHYAVGHITWGGTFLLPWFILFVLEMIEGDSSWKLVSRTGFLLFFIFLQGSFHQYVWCLIFLGLLALTGKKTFFTALKSGTAAVLLSAVRIIPPALQMSGFDDEFLGGYSSLRQLGSAFLRIIPPEEALNPAITGGRLGWWEYDMYIGAAATLFLLLFLVFWVNNILRIRSFPAILVPMTGLALFSVGPFYALVRKIPIPLLSGERVSSRFMILPFLFLCVLCCGEMNRWLRGQRNPNVPIFGLLTLMAVMLAELWSHLQTWKVARTVYAFPYTFTDLTIKKVMNHPDPVYFTGVIAGLSITLASALILLVLMWKDRGSIGRSRLGEGAEKLSEYID